MLLDLKSQMFLNIQLLYMSTGNNLEFFIDDDEKIKEAIGDFDLKEFIKPGVEPKQRLNELFEEQEQPKKWLSFSFKKQIPKPIPTYEDLKAQLLNELKNINIQKLDKEKGGFNDICTIDINKKKYMFRITKQSNENGEEISNEIKKNEYIGLIIQRSLQHENIPKVYCIGVTFNGRVFSIMEYIEGCDLQSLLYNEENSTKLRSLNGTQFTNYMKEISNTINYLHESSYVHRDIKPENIMIMFTKDDTKAYLVDFGACIHVKEVNNVSTHIPCVACSPEYLIEKINESITNQKSLINMSKNELVQADIHNFLYVVKYMIKYLKKYINKKKLIEYYNSTNTDKNTELNIENITTQLTPVSKGGKRKSRKTRRKSKPRKSKSRRRQNPRK